MVKPSGLERMRLTARTGSSTMAEEISHPHDSMVRCGAERSGGARSFLQRYVPEELSQTLNWSTLRLLEGSFVDEALRRSETDFLYEVERLRVTPRFGSTPAGAPIEPDRWMRFRLLKYCAASGMSICRQGRPRVNFVRLCRWCFTRASGAGRMQQSSQTCLRSRFGIGPGCRIFPMS